MVPELGGHKKEKIRNNQIGGIVLGIVTNNKDPDGLGRVKVNFP